MRPDAADPVRDKSPRASQPCSRCEAERRDLYALPRPHRRDGSRFDVCLFCFLKITGTRPHSFSLLE